MLHFDLANEVRKEQERAVAKHGSIAKSPYSYLAILMEEVGEVAKELNDNKDLTENYRTELLQVAAVALHAIEDYDNKNAFRGEKTNENMD